MPHYDMVVIGSGPAGQRGAIQAAKLGKRVLLVERAAQVGGVSAHTGTLPSKTLREAILYLTGQQQRGIYGPDYCVKTDVTLADLRERLAITIDHEVAITHDQLARNHVAIVHGTASFVDAHHIAVAHGDGTVSDHSTDYVLIATGTRPRRPGTVPFDDDRIVDSDSLLRIPALPRRAVVVGAGVIGLEYATMCRALGLDVTLIHGKPRVLEFIDYEIIDEFIHQLQASGMHLRLGVNIAEIARRGRNVDVILANGEHISGDLLLFTAGRSGCVDDLQLANAGLTANARGLIAVNAHFQTSVPHIYAAGDVIGFPSLAAVSFEQGRIAALHAFGARCGETSPVFPYGIYTVPEISTVGRNEQDLQREAIDHVTGRARLRETARGQILGLQEGLLKLLVARSDRRLLGVHIVGEGATELVHIGQAVLELGGTLEYFIERAFNYPTLAEAYKIAALDAWNQLRA